VLRGGKDPAKALAAFQESYDRLTLLNDKYAGVATCQAELAFSAYDLADMLRTRKETDRAWTILKESLVLRKKLVANNPTNFDYRHELAVTFGKVSDMLAAKNELGDAVIHLRQGIE